MPGADHTVNLHVRQDIGRRGLSLETLIYSQLVRNTGENLDFLLASEIEDNLAELSP